MKKPLTQHPAPRTFLRILVLIRADDEEAGDDVQGFEQPQGPNKVHPATNGDAGFNSLGAAANVGWMEDDKAANQKLVVVSLSLNPRP
jgi:hypothetical protein